MCMLNDTVQPQKYTQMDAPFVYVPYVYRKMGAYQNVNQYWGLDLSHEPLELEWNLMVSEEAV